MARGFQVVETWTEGFPVQWTDGFPVQFSPAASPQNPEVDSIFPPFELGATGIRSLVGMEKWSGLRQQVPGPDSRFGKRAMSTGPMVGLPLTLSFLWKWLFFASLIWDERHRCWKERERERERERETGREREREGEGKRERARETERI